MTVATLVTSVRLVLAPLFMVFYLLPIRSNFSELTSVILLWVILAVVEISDIIDGRIARRTGQVTDLGKLYDPFADVIARMTYFTAFILTGVMPLWTFVVIMYREFGVLFLRMRLSRKSFALGAKSLGKLKSFFYFLGTVGALAFVSLSRLDLLAGDPAWYRGFETGVGIVFALAALLSVLSFADYLRVARRVFLEDSREV